MIARYVRVLLINSTTHPYYAVKAAINLIPCIYMYVRIVCVSSTGEQYNIDVSTGAARSAMNSVPLR